VVEDNTCRKNIANGFTSSLHVSYIDDFRSNVSWSATPHEEIFGLISAGCQSKVTDGQIAGAVLPEHNVFWLKIAMDYPMLS
jgi:hypothetical protein